MVASLNNTAPSDESLAELIARRDRSGPAWQAARDACEQLYLRHARKLLAFLATRVSRSDLEDIHQAVWERVWLHLPGGFAGGNFRAWLHQIARNCAIDQGRKRRPEPLGEDADLSDRRQDRPEEVLVEHERRAILSRCLERLDAATAGLVRARLAGEGYATICQRLGLKPERAHKLFHQTKDQLQTCVERALA